MGEAIHDAGVAQAAHVEAWRRDRRGAGSVVQRAGAGSAGEAARPGDRCPTLMCFRRCSEV